MEVLKTIERYLRQQDENATELARKLDVTPRYLSEARAAKHRLSARASTRLAVELRAAKVIPDSDDAQQRFELACRNLDLDAARSAIATG